jgi:Cd2+/Zn2+-exporting ATPase/Cu+-exporting ATPase
LALAVREAGRARELPTFDVEHFVAQPGFGVRAQVNGSEIAVGSYRILPEGVESQAVKALSEAGKSLLYVLENDMPIGVLAASDTIRPEVPEAVSALRQLGIQQIELLTGDNEQSAAAMTQALGVRYQANLLPEDKIAVVKHYQAQGHVVVMVGDGVNDAPALAQAAVGIAMGATGSDIALEAAHIALMRDDWRLVPEVFAIARHTLRVVKMNFAFTTLYNATGLLLAAFGFLPPILAAVAQSLPDLGILANSARLLRQRK